MGSLSQFQTFGIGQPLVGPGKGPQNPGVEDQALVGTGVRRQVVVNAAPETSPLMVRRMPFPEGEDILMQLLFEGGGKASDFLRTHFRVHVG
jgi:hypothetical protein